MIFQSELSTLDTELSQLQALLDTKRQQRSLFEQLDAETNTVIESVALLKTKIEAVGNDAIASLKTAVLTLFDNGNSGNDGGSQPIEPTPEPDDDEPELLCLNGLTGEYLTTADLDDEELPVDNPVGDEWVLSSSAPLTGQFCAFNPELYWQTSAPDGSYWEFASPLSCLLWDDAPLIGQYCTITPIDNEISTEAGDILPQLSSSEMIHTSARTGYLKLKVNGQILSSYAWFPRKDLAEAWFDWFDGMCLGSPKLRLSQRNSSWKYEIKLTGLSMTQIERLSQEDLSRKPSKKKETPAQAAGIEPPSGWRRSQLPEAQVTASAPKKARITLESSPYNGHVCDVVEANDNWWTLATPKGNLKYPADSVEPVDDAVPMAQNREEVEAIEFNDVVEIVADGNDTVGLVGTFGRVKVVKGDRVGVEIDEQLVYFKSSELKLKVKAETPSQQQNHPPSADVSISDQEATYLQTNGNYLGLAKQTRQRWEQAGIDPSALIADMKAKRPAEPAWDAERYNPVFAGVGADDASDF